MFALLKVLLAGTCIFGSAGNSTAPQQAMTDETGPLTYETGPLQLPDETGPLSMTQKQGYIGEDEAKNIVVKDAGFVMTDVTFTKVKQEYDDGFHKIKVEYEYDTDGKTGKILKTGTDTVNDDFDDFDD